MTTIPKERKLLMQALDALETCAGAPCVDRAKKAVREYLAAPAAAPDQAFVCTLGCTTECLARQHGVPSECPSLPRQPVITPATAQAAEIARLRSESEERLQNCAALVAEVERLRKDAERYQWLAEYLVSDDESYDDAIVAATTVKEVDSVIDNAMGASPWAHCFCGVRPQAQQAWQAATAAALEIAIQVCEAIENDKWALYKGRPPYTGAEPGRADNYVQGESGGAGSCASAIRALKDADTC